MIWTVSYFLFLLKMSVQSSPQLSSHFLEFWGRLDLNPELKLLPSFLEGETHLLQLGHPSKIACHFSWYFHSDEV